MCPVNEPCKEKQESKGILASNRAKVALGVGGLLVVGAVVLVVVVFALDDDDDDGGNEASPLCWYGEAGSTSDEVVCNSRRAEGRLCRWDSADGSCKFDRSAATAYWDQECRNRTDIHACGGGITGSGNCEWSAAGCQLKSAARARVECVSSVYRNADSCKGARCLWAFGACRVPLEATSAPTAPATPVPTAPVAPTTTRAPSATPAPAAAQTPAPPTPPNGGLLCFYGAAGLDVRQEEACRGESRFCSWSAMDSTCKFNEQGAVAYWDNLCDQEGSDEDTCLENERCQLTGGRCTLRSDVRVACLSNVYRSRETCEQATCVWDAAAQTCRDLPLYECFYGNGWSTTDEQFCNDKRFEGYNCKWSAADNKCYFSRGKARQFWTTHCAETTNCEDLCVQSPGSCDLTTEHPIECIATVFYDQSSCEAAGCHWKDRRPPQPDTCWIS